MAAALSPEEVYADARAAGFSAAQATIMTAIAGAESGFDPRAHNPKPPDNSYGLGQVNMLGRLGPARRKEFGLTSNEQLFDPLTNMRASYQISGHGKNWRPWTTYTHGTYKKYLGKAQAAAAKVGENWRAYAGKNAPSTSTPPASPGSGSSSGSGATIQQVGLPGTGEIVEGARNVVIEAAFVVLGVGLLAVGVVKLATPAIKAAQGLTPLGAIGGKR